NKGVAIFATVAIPSKGQLGSRAYERCRRAKLVRGIGCELRDPFERCLKAIHHLIECFNEPLKFVASFEVCQPPGQTVFTNRSGGARDRVDGCERPSAHPISAETRGNENKRYGQEQKPL